MNAKFVIKKTNKGDEDIRFVSGGEIVYHTQGLEHRDTVMNNIACVKMEAWDAEVVFEGEDGSRTVVPMPEVKKAIHERATRLERFVGRVFPKDININDYPDHGDHPDTPLSTSGNEDIGGGTIESIGSDWVIVRCLDHTPTCIFFINNDTKIRCLRQWLKGDQLPF